MKKSFIAIVLVLCLLVGLFASGCGKSEGIQETPSPQSGAQVTTSDLQQDDSSSQVTTSSDPQSSSSQPTSSAEQQDEDETSSKVSSKKPNTACKHVWKAATCLAAKTCTLCKKTEGNPLPHTEVKLPAKHATFSKTGLTEGSHCSVCKTVIKAQETIPALGSDVVTGTDYYEKEGQTIYRYSYSFTMSENDRFILTTLKVGSDKSYEIYNDEGKLNYLSNGVYKLVFDNGREAMYCKDVNGKFEFCNKDGSEWEEQDERPQGSTSIDITPRPGNSTYGYKDLSRNSHGKHMQELYYRLYAACEAFIKNEKSIKPVGKLYVIDRINLDYYVLTADEAVAVWKVFYMENPRYYWLSNTVALEDGKLVLSIDSAYADPSYRKQCDAAINTMAAECASKLTPNMKQMNKALAIHDFILNRMNYAYKPNSKTPADEIWAHNIIGCAEKKRGVCESYAKTYQYLCLLNGIDCLVATGYNRMNHAWNITKIDGKWYGVDCTFDETNATDISYNCFGIPAARMTSDYKVDTPGNKGIDYLYQLPQLSNEGLALVDLYKSGVHLGTFGNIDLAFAAMTDANADYEIRLFEYSRMGILLLSVPTVEHTIYSTTTPKVKSLTITGKYMTFPNGFYTNSPVSVKKALTLQSDLIANTIHIIGDGSLNIRSHTLKFISSHNTVSEVHIPVKGSMGQGSPSKIVVNIGGTVDFWKPVDVYGIYQSTENDSNVLLREDSHIVEIHGYYFRTMDSSNANIKVDRYITINREESSSMIDLSGPSNVTFGSIIGYTDFRLTFGNLDELPKATINKADDHIDFTLNGNISYAATDLEGNEVDNWVETVDPLLLKEPILTLGDPSIFNRMSILIIPYEKPSFPVKEHFHVNNKGKVILKKSK